MRDRTGGALKGGSTARDPAVDPAQPRPVDQFVVNHVRCVVYEPPRSAVRNVAYWWTAQLFANGALVATVNLETSPALQAQPRGVARFVLSANLPGRRITYRRGWHEPDYAGFKQCVIDFAAGRAPPIVTDEPDDEETREPGTRGLLRGLVFVGLLGVVGIVRGGWALALGVTLAALVALGLGLGVVEAVHAARRSGNWSKVLGAVAGAVTLGPLLAYVVGFALFTWGRLDIGADCVFDGQCAGANAGAFCLLEEGDHRPSGPFGVFPPSRCTRACETTCPPGFVCRVVRERPSRAPRWIDHEVCWR